MSPEIPRTALQAARKAARGIRSRPIAGIVDALARLLDGFRTPGSAWRRGLETELPGPTGFSAEMVRAGLAHSLSRLTGEALHELVERELGGPDALEGKGPTLVSGFETTGVLLAGAIPGATLLAVLSPLLLRSGVLAKTSRHDPVTAHRVKMALAEIDTGLAACLEVVSFPGSDEDCLAALLEADCVVATGSDETVAAMAARVRPPRRLVSYGHRFSVAALGPGAVDEAGLEPTARAVALDVALWDQLGCLSPVALFVAGGVPAADRVAEALARALEDAERRWPRGRLDTAAAAAIAGELEEAEFRRAAGRGIRVLGGPEARWAVVREEDARLRPAPLHRFVRVHPVREASELLDALAPGGAQLAGVSLAGFGSDQGRLARGLAGLGASRICGPGQLQRPPLGWHHDNQGVLAPLARFADLEAL